MLKYPEISFSQSAQFEYPQIKTCSVLSDGKLHPVCATDTSRQIRARHSRAAHLSKYGSNTSDVTDTDFGFGEVRQGNVLTNAPGWEVNPILPLPERVMVGQMDAYRRPRPTMVGLRDLVSGQGLQGNLDGFVRAVTVDR